MKIKAPFITFEGGEGAGKTTQIELLEKHLLFRGIDVIRLREPGGTAGAEMIRDLLVKGDVNRWDAVSESLLLFAARRDLVQKKIIPALEAGTWVLCDRFADSTIAYQGFGHQLGFEKIYSLQRFTLGDFEPDLTFFMELSPELGIARTLKRDGDEDRYERMELNFHHRVYDGFKHIQNIAPHRMVTLNALKDIDDLHQDILDKIESRFPMKAGR